MTGRRITRIAAAFLGVAFGTLARTLDHAAAAVLRRI